MNSKLLSKNELELFLETVSRDYSVFVPSKINGFVTFKEFKKNGFIPTKYSNYDIPPAKAFLFPPIIKKYIKYPFEDMWLNRRKKALFGIRPCDAQSFNLLDKAVKDNEFYKEKRESTLIIVEACNSPLKTCFCTSVEGSPFSVIGADIFMTDIGESFVIEDISGKGTAYLDRLEDVGCRDLVMKEERMANSIIMMESRLDLESIPEKLDRLDNLFEAKEIWKKLSKNCNNCADCTSVCPTCHCCFIIEDVVEMVCEDKGDEAREYDPCMLNIVLSEDQTAEKPYGYQRLKRRLLDKFCRTMKTVGKPFCVGCGRCIIKCSVNIDIKEVLGFALKADKLTS
jgi:ferredoxin